MSHDDFDVIAYKVLSYAYKCLKSGVAPSWDKAEEVAGCNPVYFEAVVLSLAESGYIGSVRPARDMNGEVVDWSGALRVTMDGARYVDENSRMGEVKRFLGKAFDAVLARAVDATFALGVGLTR